jgi:hypothetical protein
MHPTQYSDINVLIGELLTGIRGVLGGRLVGLYLYGSLIAGDFDKDISDIDMLAATDENITEDDLSRLTALHREFALRHPTWDDRIEVQYMAAAGLKTFKSVRRRMAVISPGEKLHFVDAGIEWLVNWYFVQESGVALCGPSAGKLIDPISIHEFIRAVRDHALEWRDYVTRTQNSRPYQAYAILTMCRALYTVRNGEPVSKHKAAAWAQRRMPACSSLIADAILWRKEWRSHADGAVTFPETVRFINHVVEEIIGTGWT